MLFLARKNLFQEKTRLLISVGGVAFSVLLMILLQGLNVGFSNILGQYLESVPTDLWVASANTGNIMDPSFLPPTLGQRLKNIDGVASAQPFGMQNITTSVNGNILTITPAKLFIANNNQTTRLNTLGAYVPFNICFKPTA